MPTRTSRLCLVTCVVLLLAKLGSMALDPSAVSTRVFPHLAVGLVALGLLWIGRRGRGRGALPLALFGWVMTAHILMIAWVDRGLAERTYAGIIDDPRKVWAARGLVSDGSDGQPVRERNSIESIGHGFALGAVGCEVDVYFDPPMGKFAVSHGGPPYNRPNGQLLTLERLFDAVGDDGLFWLDWKKLRHLEEHELLAAVERLEQITRGSDLKRRMYVEGEAPLSLTALQRANFLTIFDSHPLTDDELLAPVLADLYKAVFYFMDFTVMGMPGGTPEDPIYGPETRRALRHVPVFLYHVPDDVAFLEDLAAVPEVRVILLDEHDVDRFDFVPEADPR